MNMFVTELNTFLRDERGGYTVWSLLWFTIYVAMGGLAVDITDAYRNQTMLQSTADSSALAGVLSLPDQADAVNQAVSYSYENMSYAVNGTVLSQGEVFVGTWDFVTRTFVDGGTNPNAVRVVTRRDDNNSNPLAANFLRIMGLFGIPFDRFNISVEAIAAKGVDVCLDRGIIAGVDFFSRPHIDFVDEICLIGHEQFWFISSDTTFDDSVYVGAGCGASDHKCIGPGNQVYGNADFANAFNLPSGGNYDDPTLPRNAQNVAAYIDAVQNMHTFANFQDFVIASSTTSIDYSGYEYLSLNGAVPGYETGAALPATLTPYTVYDLLTCPQSGYVMPEGDYDHVAIIADCPISFVNHGVYNLTSSLIASTFSTGGRAAIRGSASVNLGSATCGGGGNEMYSLGDIDFASSGTFSNLRILADGDVHFAATSNSPVGTNIEATGSVDITSGAAAGSTYGLCPNGGVGAQVLTVALVQ